MKKLARGNKEIQALALSRLRAKDHVLLNARRRRTCPCSAE